MFQRLFLVFTLCALSAAHAQAPAPDAAQTLLDQISHQARSKRDDARALRARSLQQLGARDYEGAMQSRWQMLGIGDDNSTVGMLTSYAIQSLALGDIETIAAHLDAPAARRYATQLDELDAQAPSYADVLQSGEIANLQRLNELTRDPEQWQKAIAELDFSKKERETLQQTPVAQIKKNIETVYQIAIEQSRGPYKFAEIDAPVDPYTYYFATPFALQRLAWTKAKTRRLLIVAALRARADHLEKVKSTAPLPPDPFGNGPLKFKNGAIYSVGPDAKDDGGKPLSVHASPDAQGDLVAPRF